MVDRTPLTTAGYEQLKEELVRLKGEERRKVVKAIEEARAHGDLSENAEYDAARQAQGLLEARVRDIETKLATAQIIEVEKLCGDRVVFGATVTVVDLDLEKETRFSIVGEEEADAHRGLISLTSPLARALIGKQTGDVAEVKLPAGTKEYEVSEIEFVSLDVRVKQFLY